MRNVSFATLIVSTTVWTASSAALAQTTAVTQPDPAAQTPAATMTEESVEAIRGCRQRLQSIEQQTQLTYIPGMSSQDLRAIREAAFAFARAGYEEGCEEIAEALHEMLEDRQDEIEEELQQEELRDATPVTQLPGSVLASTLVGMQVVNLQMDELGTVEDLILTENQGRYALVKHGGFLGLGEDYTPVALGRLAVTADQDYLVLNVSEEAMEEAPEFNEDQITDVPTWSTEVDSWWGTNVDAQGQAQPQ